MVKQLLLTFFIVSSSMLNAQTIRKPVTAILGWSHAGQQQDYLMGLDIGVMDETERFHYFITIDARPYKRKVQEFAGNNVFYQYQEERYVLTLGTRYLHELQSSGKGVFVGLSGGYNFGNYRGISLKPEQGWIIRPNAGFFWNLAPQFFTLELGYEYFDSRSDTVKDHWVFLNFLFKLNDNG
ncbi:MAG: hypothetical protein KI791_15900 [Cyclobacteriaceae bacterium]|nr:hypothetical protein [Cyclobacteriaceae bacterium SS2]